MYRLKSANCHCLLFVLEAPLILSNEKRKNYWLLKEEIINLSARHRIFNKICFTFFSYNNFLLSSIHSSLDLELGLIQALTSPSIVTKQQQPSIMIS
jgi:hypothetical protein